MKKALTVIFAFILVVVISVSGTMAYLTSTDTVNNTFTVGDVKIILDEAPVDEFGQKVTGDRVKENAYHLFPGGTYDKDPMVTVKADSEESYIRMLVQPSSIANLKAAFPAEKYPTFYDGDLFLLQKLVDGWDPDVWECVGFKNGIYEFRYKSTVSTKGSETDLPLEPLFTKIVIPDDVSNTEFQYLKDFAIGVVAEAIQADGFDDADEAWGKFPTKTA